MSKRSRRIPGITVYQRGTTWTYRLDLGTDPVTSERVRENRGGFDSEEDAWEEAQRSKSRHGSGRKVKPSRRTLSEFLREWLESVEEALKPSTAQNYRDYIGAYVDPTIGRRRLQELSVPVLNAYYRHLLIEGRRKQDHNSRMYKYWASHSADRNGLGPTPMVIAQQCEVSIHAARAAVMRFRRGRTPVETTAGLAPKTVKNVHRMLHRALRDAVAWDYLISNPAEHASLPRQRRGERNRVQPWTVEELVAWLGPALDDRFAAMWLLAATSGMRRSELAGADLAGLDLENRTLEIADTRIVVAGAAIDSDGKSDSGVRTISLDAFTTDLLRGYVATLEEEREAFGDVYPTHGKLMRFADGRPLHPDTITRRFNRLVDQAGVRRIRLHDIRHTYATLSLDSGVNPKILSDRIGHSDLSVTFQIYGHRSVGQDREAAELVANLIRETLERADD